VSIPPSFDQQYFLRGTITLPYDDIKETFQFWFDGINQKQKVEYYDGLDTYITDLTAGALWQVVPVDGVNKCIETDGQQALTNFIPDLRGFVLQSGHATVNGVDCQQWVFKQVNGEKVGVYTFSVAATTGVPVQYSWVGYDNLFGSHFDQYVVDYEQFIPGVGTFNQTTFDKPSMTCGGFPGPGFSNPAAALDTMFHPEATAEHYAEYKRHHGKPAAHDADRLVHFSRNLRFIHMRNRQSIQQGASLRLEANFLADATDAERAKRSGVTHRAADPAIRMVGPVAIHTAPVDTSSVPSSIDWVAKGAVTHVKDQGICGSCWSFGTAETIEGAHFIKTGELRNLSQQALMDCSWAFGNNACDGGESFRSYEYLLQKNDGNLPLAESYGNYLMADGRCHVRGTEAGATITGYVKVKSGDEDALMSAVGQFGPNSIAIDASLKSFSFYSHGVFYDKACGNTPDDLDHQVLAVGYGTQDGEAYWKVKNSWSTHWGDDGYVHMARNRGNNCGVATDATYTKM
jgi:C1A family cysteine protease